MNQSSEEEKIKRLFRQLRRADEQLMPPFATVYAADLSEISRAGQHRLIFRLAAALITLILLGGSMYVFFKHSSKPPAQKETAIVEPSQPLPELNKHAIAPVELPGKRSPKRTHRAQAARARQSVVAISEWRSPTSFLLTTAGDEWIKSVPRLDESVVQIKPVAPEE